MARALSVSVLALAVICAAVAFTTPSVGIILVDRRKCSRSDLVIFWLEVGGAPFDPERQAAPWRAKIRFGTAKPGFAPGENPAETIPPTSLPAPPKKGVSSWAAPPSPAANVLLSVFWYAVSFRSAAGTHIR